MQKNKMGKSAAKKKATDKKKKKKNKAAEPPPPPPPEKPEEPEKPPGPPETAVGMLRKLARAVSQSADERPGTRQEGLATLEKALSADLPVGTLSELLHALCQPLLRRFEDPVEAIREKAIRILTTLCDRVPDLGPHLPYFAAEWTSRPFVLILLRTSRERRKESNAARTSSNGALTARVGRRYLFPVLHHRGSPAKGLDVEAGVFVFDLEGYDSFKRGKAVKRPDLAAAFDRTRSIRIKEPAEELRLLLCDLLIVVSVGRAASVVATYLHEALLLFAGFARDTYGEVARRAAEGIASITAEEALQEPLVPYGTALARCLLPNLRHRHARVRKATVDGIRRSVAIKHIAKWKGAGTDAIADLVGFREDNVIPTHAFYGKETRYNYVAELTRDSNVGVRLALCEAFAEWFVSTGRRAELGETKPSFGLMPAALGVALVPTRGRRKHERT